MIRTGLRRRVAGWAQRARTSPVASNPRLHAVARRYFSDDELEAVRLDGDELVVFDARFRVDEDGNLVTTAMPDNEYLRQQVGELSDAQLAWDVVAFLKVRRFLRPDQVIERARTGELYDESYFTRRGGGAPYVGYPREFTGYDAVPWMLADECVAAYAPQRALDVGCATGLLVRELEKRDVEAHGIDVSRWAVEHRVTDTVVLGSALELPWPDDHFDLVVSQDFMEHIHPDDLPAVLREQVRVTRPGGRMVHLIPFYDSDPPVSIDAHLCQATRDWWMRLFRGTEGLRIVREPKDLDEDVPRLLDYYVELAPATG